MQSRPKQLSAFVLAIILAAGAGVAWGIASTLCIAIIDDAVRPSDEVRFRQLGVIEKSSTPIVRTYLRDGRTEYFTLDGTAINATGFADAMDISAPSGKSDYNRTLSWPARLAQIYGASEQDEAWYFVQDGSAHGHGYLVGYNSMTNRKIGYIGCTGFSPDEPPKEDQFRVHGRWAIFEMICYLPCGGEHEEHPRPSGSTYCALPLSCD